VVEHLLSKQGAQSLNSSIAKKKEYVAAKWELGWKGDFHWINFLNVKLYECIPYLKININS
jgi:hypothetical protein